MAKEFGFMATQQLMENKPQEEKDQPKRKPVKRTAKAEEVQEARSERLQLLLTPTLLKQLKSYRFKNEIKSVNDLINMALEEYLKNHTK